MPRKRSLAAQGRILRLQALMQGRASMPLEEAAARLGISTRQIRRDVAAIPDSGLCVERGMIGWRHDPAARSSTPPGTVPGGSAPAPAGGSAPAQAGALLLPGDPPPTVAEVRWADLLYMLRDGPVSQRTLEAEWRATPGEIEEDLAPLLAAGYVERRDEGGAVRYHLGRRWFAPWPLPLDAASLRTLLDLLVQVQPLYERLPQDLATALAKLRAWQEVLGVAAARRPAVRLVKGLPVRPNPLDEHEVAKLEAAARECRRVRLRYRNEKRPRVVEPLGVVYYWVTDAWYLVAHPPLPDGEPQVLRVDRIVSSRVLDEKFPYPPFDLAEHFRLHWGVEGGPEVAVRVRFYDEGGVIRRLRREVAHRLPPAGVADLRPAPGRPYWIYTDRIRGVDAFLHWLRTFGSSAVVESPASLRHAMAQRARELLEVYTREPL